MQTSYSKNSIPIDEERLMLFKNMIKKNIKIDPMKLVGYFESKYKPESEKTNPESQHKSIENEVYWKRERHQANDSTSQSSEQSL